MLRPAALARLGRQSVSAFDRAWSRLWFQDATTMPLEITRIGIGSALLIHYSFASAYLFEFWSDAGFMPLSRALQLKDPWAQSIFYYLTAPWQLVTFHGVFLFCCAAFMLGWRTSWVKWVLPIGKISYDYRDLVLDYGADMVLSSLLLILCLAPVGRALSLDRVRAVRAAKRGNLAATLPPYRSPWAGACIRLMQIQMAVIFFYTGVSKIKWDEWRNGDAIWMTLSTSDYYNDVYLYVLAHQYWIGVLANYLTIFIEVAYPFLIWQKRSRPYMLAAAIFLHLQFAVILGLIHFSFVMIMGHMSFLRPEWLHRLGAWWKRKAGDMEIIYDGHCGFCVRSMAWLLAFDGLGQIRIRDFRADPSPVVGDAQLEKALYTVLPDGRALPGFEAYRYVVLRVPGLWWLVPFFYIPGASRLLGRPIYDWIAANRSRLSGTAILKRWRQRLLYSAMSLFVGWHTFVMLVGPNNSETAAAARRWAQPYLSFFRLESTWSFFAPTVGKHSQFRYVIQDRAGEEHTFVPVRELNPYVPSFYLFKHSYDTVTTFPELHGGFFAAMFCREHAALQPFYISLQVSLEREFLPADQLAGKHPLDPDFTEVETLLQVPC
jgi:predicted DCC family thiol-disulfide oxidoreductase YuxK